MKEITANEYQKAALRTAGEDMDKYLLNAILGLCGETGEVVDIVKKHMFQGHDLDREKIAEEAGDCAWYLALLASAIGMNLGDILTGNLEKLKKRYPDGFDSERSINRNDELPQTGAHIYVKEIPGKPPKYAYGLPWVEQALFMDDIGYASPQEAIKAWEEQYECD